MKVIFCFCICLVFFSFLAASEVAPIPISEIREIALRNAEAYWGKVYAAEPIPYYDRQGSLVVWQFNFSLGKPFPNPEELKQRCRNSASKLWEESWNGEGFANLLMGARTDKPVIISFSKGLSYDYAYLTEMERLAVKAIGKDYKLSRMVHVNMGSRWFVVSSREKEYYIKAFAPSKVLGYEEFLAATDGLETPLKPTDFSKLWQEYLSGRTDDRRVNYIPDHDKMPFYQWAVGCTPCSGSMLSAWWDNMSDVSTSDYSNLIKYHYEAWDNIQDHTDYHLTDAVTALGNYMETDDEGSTYYFNVDDGMQAFFDSRDYGIWTDSDDLELEFFWDYDELFYAACAETNHGKPSLLAIPGHSITGMGYDTSGHYLLLHDPNSWEIESWHQSEFNMITYVHPSTSGWSSHVKLTYPVGGQGWSTNGTGETLYAGSAYQITWEGDYDAESYVKLWYHLGGGRENEGWTLITDNAPNTGSYDWFIPLGMASNRARIKIEVYRPDFQLLGSDGSYGNFTIAAGSGNVTLETGVPITQTQNPSYYKIPDNENSWVVVGTHRNSSSPSMALKLYENINLNNLLATSQYTSLMNLIAIDRNHLPDNIYGLKVYNTNGFVGGMTEFEGGNHSLVSGINPGLSWSDYHSVKMWDLQLNAGTYVISLDMYSGSHNLGMALFSSQSGYYIQNVSQAIANSDVSPAGGDESFVVNIPATDRYGLCVYCKDYIITGGSSSFVINVGAPGVWTGSSNRNWALAANWSNNLIPDSATNVVIAPGCSNYPYIYGGVSANCRSLTIQSGANLEVGVGTLTVSGGLTNVFGILKISNSQAVLDLNGHLSWQSGSYFDESAAGTIRVAGDWTCYNASNVCIDLSQVILDGAESSELRNEDSSSYFQNLTISKSSNRSVVITSSSTSQIAIKGNLTVQSGAKFEVSSACSVLLYGSLTAAGGLHLDNGDLTCLGTSPQTINCSSADYFNDLVLNSTSSVILASSITVRGNIELQSGLLNAQSFTISLFGDWEQNPIFTHYIYASGAKVSLTGPANSSCNCLDFNILRVEKDLNAEVVISTDQMVQCESLDFASGTLRVNGGSFTASDLAQGWIVGSYILESGLIHLFQDSAHLVYLDADLNISGGTFTVHCENTEPSVWAVTRSIQFILSGGTLCFIDNGIYLPSTSYGVNASISGGVIQTVGDFRVERAGFDPTGGTIELLGSADTVFKVSSPSFVWDLFVYKTSREGEFRTNQVAVIANSTISGSCSVQAGTILKVNNSVELDILGSVEVFGTLAMDGSAAVLDVHSSAIFQDGSNAAITNGTIKLHGNLHLHNGTSFDLPASVKTVFYSNAMFPGANDLIMANNCSLGTLQFENASGNLMIYDYGLNLNGDLIIKPNCTITATKSIVVNGKIDIWNQGALILAGNYSVYSTNLYNSGLLSLPSGISGVCTVYNTFLQYSTGQLALHGGSLVINTAYSGSHYLFGGTTNMSGGTLQITNNGMQIGTSGFNFSGGTIKLGWGFMANNANTFQPTNGMLEFIGSLPSSLSLGTGNYLSSMTINKSGTTGSLSLNNDLTVKKDLQVLGGKLLIDHHVLNVLRDLTIGSSGYLYANNSDDLITLGGRWNNQGTADNFVEGVGMVKYIGSPNTKQIDSNETFYHFQVDAITYLVYVAADKTVSVSGNLDILAGKLRPLDGSNLVVNGNLNISGAASYLDQNFDRSTANTSVHIYGNCTVTNGFLMSIDTTEAIPDDVFIIDGDLSFSGGYLNTLALQMTVHGNFSTTSTTYLETRGGSFINDAPYSGAWQIVNCPWVTWGNTIEFTNKGLQFISGSSLDNNIYTVIRMGRGLYATASGVFVDETEFGTFEFIGSVQANINLGGGNSLPSVKISKSGASVVLSTAAVIAGNLTIQSGNFNSNNHAFTLKGNWINNVGTAGYTCGTSELSISVPSTSRKIKGNQSFYKLNVNNTGSPQRFIYFEESVSTILNDLLVVSGGLHILASSTVQVNGNTSVASGARLYLMGELKLKGNLSDNNTVVNTTQGFGTSLYSGLTLNGTANQSITAQHEPVSVNGFVIDKASGSFLPYHPMLILKDLSIESGTWSYGTSGLTHHLWGSLSVSPTGNWDDNTGTIIFEGESQADLCLQGILNTGQVIANKTGVLRMTDNGTLDTIMGLHIDSGVFQVGQHVLTVNEEIQVNGGATLSVGAGGMIRMNNNKSLSVNDSGILQLMGSSSLPATMTHSMGYYSININGGGTIAADWAVFEYLNANGVYVTQNATVNPAYPFAHCIFRYGVSGGCLLKVDNTQSLSISDARFTIAGSATNNVAKTLNQGSLSFTGESGAFAGSTFENDMYQRINWSTDVPQIIALPASYDFGEVIWSQTSGNQYMIISNPGSAILHGNITTPANFSVSLWSRTDGQGLSSFATDKQEDSGARNSLEFSVPMGSTNTYALTFQPSEPIPYNGDMIITHNADGGSLVMPMSGIGVGPRISYDYASFYFDLIPGQMGTKQLLIDNTGVDSLNYFAYVSYMGRPQTTVLQTGFEDSFPPEGWRQTEVDYIAGTSATWSRVTAADHVSGSYPYAGSWMGFFNSYWAYNTNSARLESPVFSLANMNGVSLSFWMFHDSSYPSNYDYLQVQASVNGGAWVNVGSPVYRNNGQYAWHQHFFSLLDYQGQSNVRIGILGVSAYGNDILIDDLAVSGTFQLPSNWITLNGETSLWGTLQPSDPALPIDILVDTTGIPEGWYMNQLYINSNDPQQGMLAIPINVRIGNPDYELTPTSLDFGFVPAGSDSTQSFTLHNTGEIGLSGTLAAPDGYSLYQAYLPAGRAGQAAGSEPRNTLSFYLLAGEFATYMLTFSPTEAISYDAQLIISSNTGTDEYLPLFGQGVGLPVLTTTAVSNIGVTTATSGGNVSSTGNLPITERGICWYYMDDPTIDYYHGTAPGSTGEFSLNMADLLPGYNYRVRAYAINAYGIAYGNQVSFDTPGPSISVNPDSLPDFGAVPLGGDSTVQTVSVSGQSLTGTVAVYCPQGYQISLQENSGYNMQLDLNPIDYILPETTLYVKFSPFEPGSWPGALTVHCEGLENLYVQMTGTGVLPPAVETATVVYITTESATVNARIVDDGGDPVEFSGVVYSLYPDPSIDDNIIDLGAQTGWFAAELSGLIPNTSYYVRSFAVNVAGLVYGNEVQFNTLPIPQITLDTSLLNPFGSVVVGQSSNPDTLIVSAQQLVDNLIITAPDGFELSLNPLGREYSSQLSIAPITGNIEPTEVYVRFSPATGGNLSDYLVSESSYLQPVQTILNGIGIVAPSLSTFEASEIGSISATLNGSIIHNGFGTITASGFCFGTSQNPDLSGSHTLAGAEEGDFFVQLDTLEPDTQYFVRSFATNAAGTSYGNEISFRTLLGFLPAPENLQISLGTGVIQLSWDAVSNANSYYVYRSADPYAEDWGIPIAQTAETHWEDSETVGAYFYKVSASSAEVARSE